MYSGNSTPLHRKYWKMEQFQQEFYFFSTSCNRVDNEALKSMGMNMGGPLILNP